MNTIEEINSLLPDNDSRAIEPRHIREAFDKIIQIFTTNLDLKLQKTTATLTAPDTDFKYVPILNEANETRQMLAGDLGKNIANANLTSVAGAGLTLGAVFSIDTHNFPFRIENLPDVSGRETHPAKLVIDEYGNLGKNTNADIAINIPEEHTVQGVGIGNATITVNHIYPNPIPDPATIPNGIQEFMGQIKNLKFKPFTAEDWTINKTDDEVGSEFNNGRVLLKITPSSIDRTDIFTNAISRAFPHNKQWAIRLHYSSLYNYSGEVILGLAQTDNLTSLNASPMLSVRIFYTGGNRNILADTAVLMTDTKNLSLLITHSNDVIYAVLCNEKGEVRTKVLGNFDANGAYRIVAAMNRVAAKQPQNLSVSGEYWIEE